MSDLVPNRGGRPSLPPESIDRIRTELLTLPPRSAEYRKKRRELAIELDRTESALNRIVTRLNAEADAA